MKKEKINFLNLSYSEISLIREVLRKFRQEWFKNNIINRVDKREPVENITKLQEHYFGIANTFMGIGCCNNVLKKIDKYELKIQEELKKK